MPGVSNSVADALDRGWHYATLLFGETQIRTGHLLVGILKSVELRRALIGVSQEFAKLPVEDVAAGQGAIWAGSDEGNLRPMDGSGVAGLEGAVNLQRELPRQAACLSSDKLLRFHGGRDGHCHTIVT